MRLIGNNKQSKENNLLMVVWSIFVLLFQVLNFHKPLTLCQQHGQPHTCNEGEYDQDDHLENLFFQFVIIVTAEHIVSTKNPNINILVFSTDLLSSVKPRQETQITYHKRHLLAL